MGMGKTGIPWVPWVNPWEWEYDQPWNGNGVKLCGKWELRCGSGKNQCML